MSDTNQIHVARLERDVPSAEFRIDDALVAVSTLMTSVVTARRDTAGMPPARGQASMRRLVKAQLSLLDAGADILRVHGELVEIGRETAGYDLHECPDVVSASIHPIGAAA